MTYKFQQIKPQKARGKLVKSIWTDPAWSAEEKFDGDRRIAQFCDGRRRFTGTRESVDGTGYVEKTDNLPHINGSTGSLYSSWDGTVLDGEMTAPFADKLSGGKSKYVTSIMGSSPAEAIRKQKLHGWLVYRVFDCLWFAGQDIRQASLHKRRERAILCVRGLNSPYVEIVQQEPAKAIWARDTEGVIFKHRDHTYGNEKLWVKAKKEFTADVVVMGFKPGKNKNVGLVGAIIFGQYRAMSLEPGSINAVGLDKMGTARGFDDDLMFKMTAHPAKYKGRVLRITHNGREPTGAFRHPRFDCWRDDKNPKDCVYDPNEV